MMPESSSSDEGQHSASQKSASEHLGSRESMTSGSAAKPPGSPSNYSGAVNPDMLEADAAKMMQGVSAGPGDTEQKLAYCQKRIGYQFKDVSLLLEALTHASSASHRLASNERLEFLGDAVLGMVVCDWLYHDFPDYSEGDLTKIKSSVVSRKTCAAVAKQLHLERCLIVGRGVTRNRSFPKSLVSDVFEAVVAAIYLDGGFAAASTRLRAWLVDEIREAVDCQHGGNHKSQLQQIAQRDLGETPAYHLLAETGPDHNKSFQVSAVIGKRTFAPAWGRNKKDAEQRAAGNALAELAGTPLPFQE